MEKSSSSSSSSVSAGDRSPAAPRSGWRLGVAGVATSALTLIAALMACSIERWSITKLPLSSAEAVSMMVCI